MKQKLTQLSGRRKTHVIVELHPPVLLLWVRNDLAPEEDFLHFIRKLHFQLSRFMMHAMCNVQCDPAPEERKRSGKSEILPTLHSEERRVDIDNKPQDDFLIFIRKLHFQLSRS